MSAPHHRAPERTPPWTQLSARPSRSIPLEIPLARRIFLSVAGRSYYANLRANPQLTLHVNRGAEGDVEMTARPITDTGERREVLSRIVLPNELDAWIEGSPLVELTEV